MRPFEWKPKHTLRAIIAIFLTFMILKCFTFISPGYVGVIVNLLGDEKGVKEKPIHVGMHWIAPWKRLYTFPIFEQNHTWENKELFFFQTREGLNVEAEIGITFHINPESVPRIFQRYRRGMHEITHVFIRNYIRDAISNEASQLTIEEIYSSKKVAFLNNVQQRIASELKDMGIVITRVYLIDQLIFPKSVVVALNEKIAAIQRAEQRENELREAEAEAKKKVATAQGEASCTILRAEAEASANQIVAKSITEHLIRWQSISKWDGKLPQVTGSAIPMIDLQEMEK
jgi:regulator of protease activity HflC (stomatin/prohibitin superfamily)